MVLVKVDILVFGTHPDDAETGCGGLLLKLKDMGYKTGIIDLTQGELSTNGNLEIRKKETDKASRILKLDVRENLKLEDGNIKNDSDSRLKVIEAIRRYRPEVAVIPFWKDRHPDHENSYKLLKDSIFISGLKKFTAKYDFYRPDIVISYMLHYEFKPTFIVDISKYYKEKIKAVAAYESQFYSNTEKTVVTHIASKHYHDMIGNRCRYYGLKIKSEYGEPYFAEFNIKIDDPVKFFQYLV